MLRLTCAALTACALVLATARLASAGLLPVLVTINPEGDKFRWTYAIVLPTDSQLRAGDYFTVYNFAGFNPGTNAQPENWTFSSSNVGPIPPGVIPDDDPGLPNLTWTYTGPTINTGQIGLGNFWAVSDYDSVTTGSFTARTHRTSDGLIDTNITETNVPVPSAGPPLNLVPEPGTLALTGLGLPLIGLVQAIRRRKKASQPDIGRRLGQTHPSTPAVS
jgi:hypothetical protein